MIEAVCAVGTATGGSHGERDTGRWGLRWYAAAYAEYSAGGLTHFADWHRGCCDLAFALEHDLIPTGNVGVLTLFGRVTGETLPEGIHLINPLKSAQKLSVQTQSVKESANVPSNEGLILALDTSLLFRLDKSKAA